MQEKLRQIAKFSCGGGRVSWWRDEKGVFFVACRTTTRPADSRLDPRPLRAAGGARALQAPGLMARATFRIAHEAPCKGSRRQACCAITVKKAGP
jgi:hypothetical protein